jgi:cytochrome c553
MKTLTLMAALLIALGAGAVFGADAEAGKKLVTDKGCVACHGANGESPASAEYPKLAGQNADYLVKALSDYKTGKRKNPIMAGMGAGLTMQEIENLAAWFSVQQGLQVKR